MCSRTMCCNSTHRQDDLEGWEQLLLERVQHAGIGSSACKTPTSLSGAANQILVGVLQICSIACLDSMWTAQVSVKTRMCCWQKVYQSVSAQRRTRTGSG